jgi:hypothetical protein
MKTKFMLFAGLLCLALTARSAVENQTLTIHFHHDKSELTLEAKVLLRSFMLAYSPLDDLEMEIFGHTDVTGSDAYNMDLAARRSASVREYLNELGFHNLEAQVQWHGERAPVVSSSNERAHARNRRVEVVVRKTVYTSLDDVRAHLGAYNKHRFEIDTQSLAVVTCDRGSTLTFSPNSLVYPDGTLYTGQAVVEVVEALNPLDFFTEKLSTRSGNTLLISGGMLKIDVFANDGTPLELATGSSVETTLPTANIDPEMQLFVSEDGADWALTGSQSNAAEKPSSLREKPNFFIKSFEAPALKIAPKPIIPNLPLLPIEPEPFYKGQRKVSTTWWQFKKRATLIKNNAVYYEVELENTNYTRQMERYTHRYKRFQEDSASYSSRLARYEERYALWEAQCDSARQIYHDITYPEALNRYNDWRAEVLKSYRIQLQAWRDNLFESDSIEMEDTEATREVQQYLFSVNQTGWVNCDKFWNVPKENMLVMNIDVERNDLANTFILFRDDLSMVTTDLTATGQMATIPKNSDGCIISCYVEDGKLHVGHSELSNASNAELNYQTMKLSEFAKFILAQQSGSLALN